MSLVKWNSGYIPTVSKMFDDFFNTELVDWSKNNYSRTSTTLPAVNVKETKEAFLIEMAAPGLQKDDFNIEVKDGHLVLSSEKQTSNEEKDGDRYTKREFSYQAFQRMFTLPKTVDANNISARYQEGILQVNIPKKPEAKPQPAKKIEIG